MEAGAWEGAVPPVLLAAIVGLAGSSIGRPEAELLQSAPPAGIILFARNIADPEQLRALVADIRRVLPHALLMIDQEGGRVARLRAPHWREHPPARAIGALYYEAPHAGRRAAWITGALIGADCAAAGFDLVAAPVLDLAMAGGHDVIGDRAFSANPATVSELGFEMAQGLLAAGVQPIGKHAPGHGRARADSHLELPELDDIEAADLVPFTRNADLPWMMTAHIRYTGHDMRPATLSPTIIGHVIRGAIGFRGALVSDDLAMHALSGTPGERAAAALAAGCDLALHCSGVLAETADVLASVPRLSEAAATRLHAAAALADAARQPLDPDALATERARLLA